MYFFCINIIKSLKTVQQFNRAIIIIKTFFDDKNIFITSSINIPFDLSTKTIKSLRHETKFIISCNESLAKYIIKNEISQLLSKYNIENDIHGHKKQHFETTDE